MITTSPAPVVALPPQPQAVSIPPRESLIERVPHIDPMAAFESAPPPIDLLFEGGPMVGTVGTIYSRGGLGKSYLVTELACAIASADLVGRDVPNPGDLLDIKPTQPGHVVYLSYEDPAIITTARLHAMGAKFRLDVRRAIADRLHIIPIMGYAEDYLLSDGGLADDLINWCLKNPTRLIVIDTISRAHQLDENSNPEMSLLLAILERIARSTGAAVLYVHHTSKGAVLNGLGTMAQAARGASALIDNCRWAAYLAPMTAKEADTVSDDYQTKNPIEEKNWWRYVMFGVSKSNYVTPIEPRWLWRDDGGVLVPASDLYPVPPAEEYGQGARPVQPAGISKRKGYGIATY